ncbi:putative helicase [Pseudomonas phage phiK7B1]|nr:putative helicase [Pseudomonas phage phiK7B1]UIS24564.1 ATP-dependent RNA helicase [Pseudomonas phage ZY21]
MSKTLKIVHNAVRARLMEPDRQARLIVNELLSYKIESGIKGMGVAHGSMYDMNKDFFPTGFVRLVRKTLEKHGYRVIVQGKKVPEPGGPLNPVVSSFPPDPRYDYQPKTMERLVQLQRMTAQIATGGGKSEVFKLCCERLQLPTLFITTRKSLMYQMAKGYKSVKSARPVGFIGDGHWSPEPNGVNFAIVDTLVSRMEKSSFDIELNKILDKHVAFLDKEIERVLKKATLPINPALLRKADAGTIAKVEYLKKKITDKHALNEREIRTKAQAIADKKEKTRAETIKFLEQIGFLTLEEAHEVSGTGFFELCNAMTNAHYRLALTATPNMKDSEEANMRLAAVAGTIGIRVTEKELIDKGILATPIFKFVESKPGVGVTRGSAFPVAYERGIVKNAGRNTQIMQHVLEAKKHGLTTMILVQHTAHGDTLKNLLQGVGLKANFIRGEDSQEQRQTALDSLGAGGLDVLIGTTILDVGVDVPSVGQVILAGGGKAEVAVRQRVGRGLRAKKKGPNVCFVVMFSDNWNTHTNNHSRECLRIIQDTPGFVENIVPTFDFKAAGF